MSDGEYGHWIGRQDVARDVAQGSAVRRLAALLDHRTSPWPDGQLPPLGHWLFNLPDALQSELGEDGHPRKGGFLPPIDLPRRMWAGSRLTFEAPIAFGVPVERRSTIASIVPKHGASGRMVFVTLRHEVLADGALAAVEEQDIVYRDAPPAEAAPVAAAPAGPADRPSADAIRLVRPDPVMLFRFSALTFNAHRIHYDRDYARSVEGYPGLVVHGPFIATLLMDHFLRETARARVTAFEFRARRPLFDLSPFRLCLRREASGAALWAENEAGETAMTARVTIDPREADQTGS